MMSKKNKVKQRPYGKKTRREARRKILEEKTRRESHERYQKLNEQFRAGDSKLLAKVEKTRVAAEQAVKDGRIEENVYLLLLENLKSGNPFCSPI